MNKPIIKIRHLTKSFPGVVALNDVSLEFYSGKVNVLLGENGAGKSTLIKIISGLYLCNQGEVYYEGKKVKWKDTREALKNGISVIHQELSVIDDLSISENIFLGREPLNNFIIDKKSMNKETKEILNSMNMDLEPNMLVKNLSAAEKQMIEIARAVSQKAKVVIMDEPTSSLTNNEVDSLFRIIEDLKRQNVCIIYISHRLSEIKQIGDIVTILKDGNLVKVLPVDEADEKEWVRLMVGRDIRRFENLNRDKSDEIVLSVKNISNRPLCKNASFDLYKGEILGIAGLIGSGRTELLRAIFGADPRQSGVIKINGKEVSIKSTSDAIKNGIALIPEDRRKQGLLLEKNIVENVELPNLYKWKKKNIVDKEKAKNVTNNYIEKLIIKVPSLKSFTKLMSGGNQQKVVLAKWLAANCSILFMDEPTRGIDVNAKNEIYLLMLEFVKQGGSIIMVSSELPEVLGISDRILIMREGESVATMDSEEVSEESIIAIASIN